MNILITTEYYFGNPDLVRLSIELAKRGHQVYVLTSYSPSFYEFDKLEGVPSINILEANPHVDIASLPYTVTFPFAQVAGLIKQHRIEVCHTIMARATNSAVTSFVAKQLGIPMVHTVQGIGTDTGRPYVDIIARFYDSTVVRLILKSAKKVIVLSKTIGEYAVEKGADPDKIAVIPSGVDCVLFDPSRMEAIEGAQEVRKKLGISTDALVVGYIGRIVPVKGLKYLILAISEVQKKNPDTDLLIVGDGLEKFELETLAKKLNLNVHFVGWARNVLPYYATVDIFVLPSLLEGLSNSLLEAMAMGKPVIATNVGGNKDVVVNGKNGFLVPVGSPSSISLNLKKLIECGDLRKKMGTINRETVKRRFSWKDSVSKVESIYENLTD